MARPQPRKMAQPKRRNSYGQRPSAGSGPWLIAGVALALFILGLFYLHHHRKHSEEKVEPKKISKVHVKRPAQIKTAENKQATPQFDFYTLLPDRQIGDSGTTPKSAATGAPVSQPKAPLVIHQYILQVGAFKRLADADKVRADLILQGYNVQIKAVQVNGVTWQRIIIGPYKTLSEAQQAQDKLTKAGIKSLLFQLA
ncbi:MAG: putative cell division protein [Gammaproteobacteria bacterium]|jgi:cell division protein FtsN|nr:putative cell division protein [Gammaproteobacteria bacterium]